MAGLAFSAARVFVTSPGGQVGDVDVVRLKDAAQVGLVRCARAQPLDRRLLVAEGLKEGERKLLSVKRLLRQRGNGFFDLNGVQLLARFFRMVSSAFLAFPGVDYFCADPVQFARRTEP